MKVRSEWCGLANKNSFFSVQGDTSMMPVGKFFFLATPQATHHIIVGMEALYVRSRTYTDRSIQSNQKINYRRGKCNTNRQRWSITWLEDRAMDSFPSRGLLGDEWLYGLVEGRQSNDWLIYTVFNPQGQETQIVFKQNKKKLIMSCLVWLMIKDNYFFIPPAKAECVPSDVAT